MPRAPVMVLTSKRPSFYPHAEDFHHECGAYQLRAVLLAHGKDVPVRDLYHSEAHARRDWSLPWNMPRILGRHGIFAQMFFRTKNAFAPHAAESLEQDKPTLFVVRSIQGETGRLHWLSIWGHDEETNEFLCYDSQAPEASGDSLGNIRYHADFLTERLPWKSTFLINPEL